MNKEIKYTFEHDVILWSKGWYNIRDENGRGKLSPFQSLECVIQHYYGNEIYNDRILLYYIMKVAKLFNFDLYDIIYNELDDWHLNTNLGNWFEENTWRNHLASKLASRLSGLRNDKWEEYRVCKINRENLNPNIMFWVNKMIKEME